MEIEDSHCEAGEFDRESTICRILQLQEMILEYERRKGRRSALWPRLKAWSKRLFVYAVVGKKLSKTLTELICVVRERRRPYLGTELAKALEAASRKVMGYKRWLLMLGLAASLPGMLSLFLLWQQNQVVKDSKTNRIADLRNNKRVELLITVYHTFDKTEAGLLTTPVFSAANRRDAVLELIQWDAARLAKLEEEDLFQLNRMVDLSIAPLNGVDFSPSPGESPFFFKNVGFNSSNFEDASFEQCRFEHVWFSAAQLYRTNFRQAVFKDVWFDETRIIAADFSGAEFILCKFEGAVFDETTVWPKGFDPLAHGAVLERSGR